MNLAIAAILSVAILALVAIAGAKLSSRRMAGLNAAERRQAEEEAEYERVTFQL